MINIICNDLGHEFIEMRDLITMDRAKEFLQIYENSNSMPWKKSYYIEDTTKR